MTTTAELNYDGYIITIVGEYNAPERGSRDRWGAPLEPDCDAYFDILSTHIGDVEFKDNEELAFFLETTEDNIDELLQDALGKAYESELEAYHDAQAEAYYENLRCRYYD
jgi:hypothetical protein